MNRSLKICLRVWEALLLSFLVTITLTSNIFIPIIGISLFIQKFIRIIIGLWILIILIVSIILAFAPWGIYEDIKRSRAETLACLKKVVLLMNPASLSIALLQKSISAFKANYRGIE